MTALRSTSSRFYLLYFHRRYENWDPKSLSSLEVWIYNEKPKAQGLVLLYIEKKKKRLPKILAWLKCCSNKVKGSICQPSFKYLDYSLYVTKEGALSIKTIINLAQRPKMLCRLRETENLRSLVEATFVHFKILKNTFVNLRSLGKWTNNYKFHKNILRIPTSHQILCCNEGCLSIKSNFSFLLLHFV